MLEILFVFLVQLGEVQGLHQLFLGDVSVDELAHFSLVEGAAYGLTEGTILDKVILSNVMMLMHTLDEVFYYFILMIEALLVLLAVLNHC